MKCQNCGELIHKHNVVCPACGAETGFGADDFVCGMSIVALVFAFIMPIVTFVLSAIVFHRGSSAASKRLCKIAVAIGVVVLVAISVGMGFVVDAVIRNIEANGGL